MSANAAEVIERMISLFDDYSEAFGLSDADFPHWNPLPQEQQCDFEDRFKALICDYKGHDIGPDQCCKPEHDFCYRCHKLRVDLEQSTTSP